MRDNYQASGTFLSFVVAFSATSYSFAQSFYQEGASDFISQGELSGDFRLRYAQISQDAFEDDAMALILRSYVQYKTARFQGLSLALAIEDSRPIGIDDYSVPQTDFNSFEVNGRRFNEFPVAPDPRHTELETAYIEYKNERTQIRLGRQEFVIDNNRFFDNAGWRQDHLNYDGVTINHQALDELKVTYAYLANRNLPFGDVSDVSSDDHALNLALKTDFGTLSGYGYFLDDTDSNSTVDTFGIRFDGAAKISSLDRLQLMSLAEYATQDQGEFTARYLMLETGIKYDSFTFSAGQEFLGSAEGAYGFSTPVGAVHGFNGWADVFVRTPDNGLVDRYITLKGDFGKSGKAHLSFHDFSAAEDDVSIEQYGTEIDASYVYSFGQHYSVSVKLARYSAEDGAETVAPNTNKYWLWMSAKF